MIVPGAASQNRIEACPESSRRSARILGLGSALPGRVLTNADLETIIDTSDEWIVSRTGMKKRHVVGPSESTGTLAVTAARRALEDAEVSADCIDVIIIATITPDQPCPATACKVQAAIGATRAIGFDLAAACTGFVNALAVASSMIQSGAAEKVLVIGADTLSTITDYESRDSCILFGDGAGAAVIGADSEGPELLDLSLGMDGRGYETIGVPAGGSALPASEATLRERQHFLRLDGREVFRFAVQKLVGTVKELAERNGVAVADLDHIVPHQANLRILEAAAKKLGLPLDRFVIQIEEVGNTSAASVPMALDSAARAGRIEKGDLVALVAFGGGLTWGGALFQW
ncbi:MAG: beta-ketoacyl-ACP synthase III [Planctomycetota bacterium]